MKALKIGPTGKSDEQPGQVALRLLYSAHQYALETRQQTWQFALEIAELKRFGLTCSEFRWLLAHGYAEHALELTRPNSEIREFQPLGRHQFPDSTCFVLTETGVKFVENAGIRSKRGASTPELEPASESARRAIVQDQVRAASRPNWDPEQRELLFHLTVVKRFRRPAPNQELILSVFQEEGWPRRIDDPLPNPAMLEPGRRLHDTIKCLNRNQISRLIRFRGDGTGEGVVWETCC